MALKKYSLLPSACLRRVRVTVLGALWIAVALISRGEQTNEVELLKSQLRELQQQFERVQAEQRQQIEKLNQKLQDALNQQKADSERKKLEQELASELATNQPPAKAAETPTPASSAAWSPASPIRVGGARAYMDLGLVGTFAVGGSTANDIAGALELGGHDPNQNGFTVQGVEANFAGAVDPYFRGNANVLFQVDENGESLLELEEAWLETFALPAGFQVRAGQYLTEFGRQNPTHPHAWSFVDTPLVLGRFLGPDGLRNPGARVSWLAPTPFYSELFLNVQNSQGETAYSFRSENTGNSLLPMAYRYADNNRGVEHVNDLLFTPRFAVSLDLSETQVLLAGASAAFGPNSRGGSGSGSTVTEIYGVDLTWKWKSPTQHGGFPFVSFQTEGLLRRYEVGSFDWDLNGNGTSDSGELLDVNTGRPALLEGETLTDYGLYSQVLYGFRKAWVAGLRCDFVTSDKGAYERRALALDGESVGRDPLRAQRWRLSPNLTWYPSEFSKFRLQYNYDNRLGIGEDHSVWLQFEFLLGAHAAHQF